MNRHTNLATLNRSEDTSLDWQSERAAVERRAEAKRQRELRSPLNADPDVQRYRAEKAKRGEE